MKHKKSIKVAHKVYVAFYSWYFSGNFVIFNQFYSTINYL